MKRVVLSLVVGLALLAVPAIAQTYSDTTPAENPPVQEERTNPSADSMAPDSGLTLTGTVVSWNDDQLVVKTVTGVEHIQLLQTTSRPATFTAGETVTVHYTRTSQNGVMVAQQVLPSGTGSGTTTSNLQPSTTTTTPSTTTTTESQLEQDLDEAGAELSEVDDRVEEEIEEAVGGSIDNDGAIGNDEDPSNDDVDLADTDTMESEIDSDTSALPATGSKAPLVGLLGLLALGAAAGLRRL
jgi:hypothetical protein